MKLWVDDVREPPDGTWYWARTCTDALEAYSGHFGVFEIISFDHDLGSDRTTMPLAKVIEEGAAAGVKPPKWSVHSMNPVGKANLEATLRSADRLYMEYTNSRGAS